MDIQINAWSPLFINLKIYQIWPSNPDLCPKCYQLECRLKKPNSQSEPEKFWNLGAQLMRELLLNRPRSEISKRKDWAENHFGTGGNWKALKHKNYLTKFYILPPTFQIYILPPTFQIYILPPTFQIFPLILFSVPAPWKLEV